MEDGDRAAAAALKVVKRGGAVADVGETNIDLQDCQVELYFDYMGSNSQCWSQVSVLDPGSLISKFIHFDQLMKVLRFKLTLWSCVILRPVEYVTQCKSVNSEDCYTSYINLQGGAKKILLSSVTHVPSGLIGCALAA